MTVNHVKFVITPLISALCFSAALSLPVSAETHQEQLAALEQRQNRNQRELEFNKAKLGEAQRKLQEMSTEFASQTSAVADVATALAEDGAETAKTPMQQERLRNERQRLSLMELALQSQQALVDRLARKQNELDQSTDDIQQSISRLNQTIAEAEARATRRAAQQSLAQERELAFLRQENAELEQILAMERDRLVRAELRVEELVRIADAQELQISQLRDEIAVLNSPAPILDPEVVGVPGEVDLSQAVLEGETPIAQDDDGEDIVMRSHSINTPLVLEQIGPNLYQGDTRIEPGKAYFDLRRRRYRGFFNEEYAGEYRFYYDLSDAEKPRLYVQRVEDIQTEITDSADFF